MNPFRLKSRVRTPPLGSARQRASPPGEGQPLAVPWRVRSRLPGGVIEVEHCGSGPAHSVRFALAGSGVLGLSLPSTVLPGELVRVSVKSGAAAGCAAAPDALLVLRWFEPDGREFLWPIVLE